MRHAHSHLMYFSWATPAIIALLGSAADERGGSRPAPANVGPGAKRPGWSALLLGFASYPAFLAAGYGPVSLWGKSLPLASILSGFTIFAWYAFAAWYAARRRRSSRSCSRLLWDAALFGLMLSTLGAWGRAALQLSGVGTPALEDLAVYFFLGAFSEGWLLLAVLGFALAGDGNPTASGRAHVLLWLGLPCAALLGFSGSPGLELVIRAGAFLFVAGLAVYARELVREIRRRERYEWLPFLAYFLVHLTMQAGLLVPAVAEWGARLGLRVLYLHVMALGAVSSGLFAAARERWGQDAAVSPWSFGAAVLIHLAALVVLAIPQPAGAGADALRAFAAWSSLGPILPPLAHVVTIFLFRAGGSRRARGAADSPGRLGM